MRTVTAALVLISAAAIAVAGEAKVADLMPRPEDRTAMWWRDGFPTVVDGADWRRVVRTGRYWFLFDTDTLDVARLGPSSKHPGELPGAELELTLNVDGTDYRCQGGGEFTRFGGPRLIESGRFLQRSDVTDLVFATEDGTPLNVEARLETVAWADQLGLVLFARPGRKSIGPGEESFGRVRGGFGLDGGNRLDIPATDAETPEQFTLEFWVFMPTDYQANRHAPWLVCKNAHEAADGNYGIVIRPEGTPDVRLNIGGGRDNAVEVIADRQHRFRFDQWNHVAISHDGDTLRLYLNGQFAVEKFIGKKRVPVSGGLTFGGRGDGLDGFQFRGVVDQVKLFDRALTMGQLRHSFHHPEQGLPHLKPIREWTFSEEIAMSKELPRETWESAEVSVRLTSPDGELLTRADEFDDEGWRTAAAMFDPVTFRAVPDGSPIVIEAMEFATGESRPVSFDPAVGWHRVNLDGIEPIPPAGKENPSNDAIERVQLRLSNPAETEQVVRLMFEKTASGIHQKIGAPITGITAVLLDRHGQPTGLPVQLSKNWHVHPEAGVHSGQWFHGVSQVRLPAKSVIELELVLTYGHWGGLPAASHSQLSLIGWGGNHLWDQSALGAWGESICYSPEYVHDALITDVRPLLVTSMKQDSPQYAWTSNVGGGDFFHLTDPSGNRVPSRSVRATYHRSGPCLTETMYAGRIGEGIAHRETVSLARSDDLVRGTYRIRMDVTEPVEFSRFVIFQIGADSYSPTGERLMAIGNETGLSRTWRTEWGGDEYRAEPFRCSGRTPWASLHDAVPRRDDDSGAWANRGIVIREWKARLGGSEVQPWMAEHGLSQGRGEGTSTLDLVPPPEITRLEPGDFVEATIEHLVIPQFADDYYGPNESLKAVLRQHENTWRMVQREAVGNDRRVEARVGTFELQYPDVRIQAENGVAEFQLSGGVGYVPITFTGLDSHTGWRLTIDGEVFDQSVHGSDYWQTDFDSATRTWSQTFNVPAGVNEESRVIRFDRTTAP